MMLVTVVFSALPNLKKGLALARVIVHILKNMEEQAT